MVFPKSAIILAINSLRTLFILSIVLNYIIKSLSSLLFLPSAFAEPVLDSGILWDRIASIEYIGYEYVYDIEVDGTHAGGMNGGTPSLAADNNEGRLGMAPGASANAAASNSKPALEPAQILQNIKTLTIF